MKVCVLQPDYAGSAVEYQYYDPPRNLSDLLPEATVDHVYLHKLHTYRQLKALRDKGYDIFVNLCEGYLEWDIPSIDVIHALESLGMPHTGPSSLLYNTPKPLMKYVAYTEGVRTPAHVLARTRDDLVLATRRLSYPLFVKPAVAGDSLGVDAASLVHDDAALYAKATVLFDDYGEVLVEEYISGREFTVLVAADPANPKQGIAFLPVEFVFPENLQFKTYALKTSELHPECNVPCTDPVLDQALRSAALRIFRSFGGEGYARMDFRVNARGEVYFLELNFTCSVFYRDGYEGSADYVLRYDGIGQADFLRHIIAEGLARHRRKQPKYTVRGDAVSGYGIYARHPLAAGEVIFAGEEGMHRLATRRHVADHWNPDEQLLFRRYAFPVSGAVFILWDENPARWAPQNHSCEPNTGYAGLNVVALRAIPEGEELTLDYATVYDERMEPFECHCGAAQCRRLVRGTPGNSITTREDRARETMQ